jgi:hypothetical protein
MGAEFFHEAAQEGCCCVVGDLAILGENLRRVLDVGLRCGHLAGIAEAEDSTQALLGDGGADLVDRGADDRGRYVVEGVLPPGPRGPVDGILQTSGNGSVVFGGDEGTASDALMASFKAVASGG